MTDQAIRLKITGSTSLFELWGDSIVYRNLIPADARLPSLEVLRSTLGLAPGILPRKVEVDYGRVVAEILRCARQLDLPGDGIRRLVFVGDTRMLDGTAFQNLRQAGGWPGWAFICSEKADAAPAVKIEGQFYLANRWSALQGFLRFLEQQDFVVDEYTAVVIDMDKTSVGARGRNDKVIDEARLEGVRRTLAVYLGEEFNENEFRSRYTTLNQPAYHPFTADNQDYLAYICLMLGTPLFQFEALLEDVQAGRMKSFFDFIIQVQARRSHLPHQGLLALHDEIWSCVQAGDPTPFKAFRYNEYLTTAARFGGAVDLPVAQALARHIVITQEVRSLAQAARGRGALVFGLSDKPDEASFPQQQPQGMGALHRLQTLVVGEDAGE